MFSKKNNGGMAEIPPPAKNSKGSKMCQKKTQLDMLEHILLRPDVYIGSVERVTETMWVFDKSKECMVQRELNFVPGLYKIYDEIIIKAVDNKQRDPQMDVIKIDINQEQNTISVYNNGYGLPIVMHKDEKIYIPTMIYGRLSTSNYNNQEIIIDENNVYGTKLCNIFSTKFTVKTSSKRYKKYFKQTWSANMTKVSEPKVKEALNYDFTEVIFSPDLLKFKMEKLEDDIVALMSRRAYDIAMTTGVKVYLNNECLRTHTFKDYVDLYIKEKEDENGQPLKVVHEKVNNRWEIALTVSDRGFQQVSFVNSIATTNGGEHVDTVTDSIIRNIIEILKNKGCVNITPVLVKNHMWIFINCLIVNPTFDSITKENMTLHARRFGSKCNYSEEFVNALTRSGLLEAVSYSDFLNLSIPSMIDGLKPAQRKVIYTCIKRNDKRRVKVTQLAGSVVQHSKYYHGERSLTMTIVNLAQNFVGTNNINLLLPYGQFGSRLNGGKDSANPYYLETIMSPITRLIFHPYDDPTLKHSFEDNQKVEPIYYIPILPMVLVNGAEGVGADWSTKIPSYNPRDICDNLRHMLDGYEPKPMHPWYKNFRGTIKKFDGEYVMSGDAAILPGDEIEITELPVGTCIEDFKENVLEPLLGTDKMKVISQYKDYSTPTTVRLVASLLPGKLAQVAAEGVHQVFKLHTTLSLNCMNGLDHNGCLKKYEKVEDILKDFYEIRLKCYERRKIYLEGQLEAEAIKLSNQVRFIMEICAKELVLDNMKQEFVVKELINRGYDTNPIIEWKKRASEMQVIEDVVNLESEEEPDQDSEEESDPRLKETEFHLLTEAKKFNYLLGMTLWMLTKETEKELHNQREAKLTELNALKAKTPSMLWRHDLDEFQMKLEEIETKERQQELDVKKTLKKRMKFIGSESKNMTGSSCAQGTDQRQETD